MSTASNALNPAPDTLTVPAGCAVAADKTMPGLTVKLAVLDGVPPGAITEILPVEADAGTVAVMVVSDLTVARVAAAGLPNTTAAAPVNPDPVMVTLVPIVPELGLNEWTTGPAASAGAAPAATVPAMRATASIAPASARRPSSRQGAISVLGEGFGVSGGCGSGAGPQPGGRLDP